MLSLTFAISSTLRAGAVLIQDLHYKLIWQWEWLFVKVQLLYALIQVPVLSNLKKKKRGREKSGSSNGMPLSDLLALIYMEPVLQKSRSLIKSKETSERRLRIKWCLESSWFQQGAQQKVGEGREGDDCIRLRNVKKEQWCAGHLFTGGYSTVWNLH